jgi:ubiquinol-cytochrome c reductase cytochrome c1 subunit
MNKELKIFGIVAIFTLVLYWGVEPFAHSQMHKHVKGNDFKYPEFKASNKKGNSNRGRALVTGAAACTGCHGIKVINSPAPMDASMAVNSYGVNPPDLSSAGALYNERFLAALIKNPAHALKVEHKFDPAKGKIHPMTQFYGAGGDIEQEIADIIAFLKSISPAEMSNKEAFQNACGRCHANRYGKLTQLGEIPKFKYKKDELKYKVSVIDYQDKLKAYMGKLPPDLSIIIRARSEHFLKTFVENPQSQLPGTSMPSVGLTNESFEKVMAYLEETGDPSKPARKELGPWVLMFFIIFAGLAFLWKKEKWKGHH